MTKELRAFTLLEIVITIALIGIISSIIFMSLNRFNEQLKADQKVKHDLTNWFTFRSSFWMELDRSDSIVKSHDGFTIFNDNRIITYEVNNIILYRTENTVQFDTGVEVNNLKIENTFNGIKLKIDFLLNNETISFWFVTNNSPDKKINSYFNQIQ
jgi:prepilin-type N-terminal cleavage/methylation domain-containing protein